MMIRTPKMRLPSQLSYYILYPKVPYIIRMKLRVYCQKGELSNLRTDWKYPRALWVYEALWKRGPQTEYMSMLMSVSVAVATSKCCWQNKFPFDDLDDLLWHNFFCKYFRRVELAAAAELLMPIPTWHNSFGHNSFGKWMHKKFSFFSIWRL